jgi:shikimate dehydrogenase
LTGPRAEGLGTRARGGTGVPDLYAVLGHPIAHSKSPRIHAAFARQTGQDLVYEAIDVAPGGFAAAVWHFRARGGVGLNVTLPYKEEAFALAQARSARAEQAGAVNTLGFEAHDRLWGDNTDGAGLVRDLTLNLGVTLRGRRVLLLGAGGAARGVIGPLLGEGAAVVVIANRTITRGEELAETFRGHGPVEACGFADLAGRPFDLVVNATSASLQGEVPPLPAGLLAPGAWCYDMMYADRPTAFVRWGEAQGAAGARDGLGMLVEQAAESFFLWRGVRPDAPAVIAALRAAAL